MFLEAVSLHSTMLNPGQEPWYNLASRVFAKDEAGAHSCKGDMRTLAHYEAQLQPRVQKFLNMAMDRD